QHVTVAPARRLCAHRRVPRTPSDLRRAIGDPAFTPAVAEVPALVALVAEDEEAGDAERALARQPVAAVDATRAALARARAPGRARLVRLLGRLATVVPGVVPALVELASDADPKASRIALVALGKHRTPDAEEALVRAARAPRSPAHLRAAIEALGK